MRRFSNPAAFVRSFISLDVFADAARQWKGVGLVYLLMLITLSTVFSAVFIQVHITRWVRNDVAPFVGQFPVLDVDDGQARIDRPSPYSIVNPHTGELLAIFDTSGQVTTLDRTTARFLVTRDRLYVRKSMAETRVFELASVKHLHLDPPRIQHWLALVLAWIGFASTPFVFIAQYLYGLVLLLASGVIVSMSAQGGPAPLDLAAGMRVAAVATGPAIAIDIALGLAGAHLPFWWLVRAVIPVVYAIVAVRSIAPAAAAPTSEVPPTP